MNALILDGSEEKDRPLTVFVNKLKSRLTADSWCVNMVTLRDEAIAPCLGCFGCWVKTPGECVIDDAAREVARCAAKSELWVFVTRVAFGGYSSVLKKAVDRMICLGLPFFKEVKGDTHHPLRYARAASLLCIGLAERQDTESSGIFADLTSRNAINFHSPVHYSGYVHSDSTDEEIDGVVRRSMSAIRS